MCVSRVFVRFREVMKVCPAMYSVEFFGGTQSDMANSHRNNGCIKKVLFTMYFRYGTLVRTELRTLTKTYEYIRKPTKTHENSNLVSDPLTFVTFRDCS